MKYKTITIKPFGICITPLVKQTNIKDIDINALKKLFHQAQLIILRGFKTFDNAEEFSCYCDHWGEVSQWPFGTVLQLIEQDAPKDHIFDHSYMPMHWDGMYRPQVPEYQIFHCVQAPLPGQGGRTTFSNTNLVLKHMPETIKSFWRKVTGTYQREMQFYKSKTISPVIVKHPYKDIEVIRYNEPHTDNKGHFINPSQIAFCGLDDKEQHLLHQSLRDALYNSDHFYAHEWQTGDIVIADNFTLLHGREAFTSKSPRHINRVHVLSDPPYNNPGLESYQ